MDLDPAVAWSALARDGRVPFRYIADPSGPPIAAVAPPTRGSSAILAIGPEGGFAPEELAEATAEGWRPVALGAHILRIETAALVGAATLLALAEGAG